MTITYCPRCQASLISYSYNNSLYSCPKCPKLYQNDFNSNDDWLRIYGIKNNLNDINIKYWELSIFGYKIQCNVKYDSGNIYSYAYNTNINLCPKIELLYKSDDEILLWIKTMWLFK